MGKERILACLDDSQLLARAQANERGAFDRLIGRYGTDLLRFLSGRLPDRDVALDVFQDVLVRAIVNVRAADNFRPWIYGIAIHAVNDYWRREKSLIKRLGEYEQRISPRRSQSLSRRVLENDLMRRAIYCLSETDRLLIRMHCDGYSMREIGNALGYSEKAVKVRAHRARKRMRRAVRQTSTVTRPERVNSGATRS